MADKQTIELLKEAARLRTAAKAEIEKITKELLKQGNISEAQARVEAKKQEGYKKIVEQLKEINSQVQDQRTAQKEAIGSLMQQEQRLKSFSGLQQSIVGFERKKIELLAQQGSMHQNQKDAFGRISDLNQELLGLSAEDIVSRGEISRQIEAEIAALDEKGKRQNGLGAGSRELLAVMKKEYAVASNISNLTQDQQKQLEAQLSTYDSIKKSIGGVLDTAAALTSTLGAAVGGLLIGVGMVADKFGQVNRELGQSFLQGLNKSTMSATALGFIFDDTAGTVRELASEFGGVDAATLGTQTNIGLMATNMGISNKEAVSLTASFARMNGGSTDIAADMVKTTQEFANQNGIIPAALMQDLAGATEEFALFGKDGGQNILRAAGYAQKLGVNMKTLSGLADNLLDFESSITKELELGAMLGKNINLDKARQLAYQGDIEGATKATLNELGGIEAFNKMDYFQKKATADLLGTSVAELQKMADNQGKANTLGAVMNENFSKAGEFINAGLNKYLGTGLKGLGGMVTMAGQLGTGFSALGVDMAGITKSIGGGLKKLLMWPFKKLGGAFGGAGNKMVDKIKSKFSSGGITDGVADKAGKSTDAASKTPKKSDGGLQSLAKGLKAMGDPKVLFGALNLIPTALGFVAILPGLPGMLGVSLLGVGAGTGILSLSKGLKQMGNPKVLFGALNLIPTGLGFALMTLGVPGMIGVALLGIAAGAGLTALGTGLAAMSAGLVGAAALAVAGIGFAIMTLGIPGMIGVALLGIPASIGLGALAVGLTTFGAAAMNPLVWAGVGLLAALGLSLIPMAAALAIAAPAITAFGDVIGAAFGGIATIITATSEGLTNMLGVITLEKAAAMLALAGAFPLLAAGIGALGIATFVGGGSVVKFLNNISEAGSALAGGASDAIQTTAASMMSMATALTMINNELERLSVEKLDALADFSMNVSVGSAVSAVGESIGGLVDSVSGLIGGGGDEEKEDKNQLLIDEIKGLRSDLLSGKIGVYMDGEKVTSRVSAAVERVGGNSYAMS